jgi:hypothetical protein
VEQQDRFTEAEAEAEVSEKLQEHQQEVIQFHQLLEVQPLTL